MCVVEVSVEVAVELDLVADLAVGVGVQPSPRLQEVALVRSQN